MVVAAHIAFVVPPLLFPMRSLLPMQCLPSHHHCSRCAVAVHAWLLTPCCCSQCSGYCPDTATASMCCSDVLTVPDTTHTTLCMPAACPTPALTTTAPLPPHLQVWYRSRTYRYGLGQGLEIETLTHTHETLTHQTLGFTLPMLHPSCYIWNM
jgi:hypothetical protein